MNADNAATKIVEEHVSELSLEKKAALRNAIYDAMIAYGDDCRREGFNDGCSAESESAEIASS